MLCLDGAKSKILYKGESNGHSRHLRQDSISASEGSDSSSASGDNKKDKKDRKKNVFVNIVTLRQQLQN